jgi:hypothetical protein
VKNRFQSLPFKCNLQRYTEAERGLPDINARLRLTMTKVGLYEFNAADDP